MMRLLSLLLLFVLPTAAMAGDPCRGNSQPANGAIGDIQTATATSVTDLDAMHSSFEDALNVYILKLNDLNQAFHTNRDAALEQFENRMKAKDADDVLTLALQKEFTELVGTIPKVGTHVKILMEASSEVAQQKEARALADWIEDLRDAITDDFNAGRFSGIDDPRLDPVKDHWNDLVEQHENASGEDRAKVEQEMAEFIRELKNVDMDLSIMQRAELLELGLYSTYYNARGALLVRSNSKPYGPLEVRGADVSRPVYNRIKKLLEELHVHQTPDHTNLFDLPVWEMRMVNNQNTGMTDAEHWITLPSNWSDAEKEAYLDKYPHLEPFVGYANRQTYIQAITGDDADDFKKLYNSQSGLRRLDRRSIAGRPHGHP